MRNLSRLNERRSIDPPPERSSAPLRGDDPPRFSRRTMSNPIRSGGSERLSQQRGDSKPEIKRCRRPRTADRATARSSRAPSVCRRLREQQNGRRTRRHHITNNQLAFASNPAAARGPTAVRPPMATSRCRGATTAD
ncbi:hypothetical protein L596_007705 [Steinernema carpocapsae]|uniref:Uncharacterized protein n=1 Tax=Steinernema carpocapsae TaxID=34508 RepID=A0A4U5PA92_STECR|nr:hypothetical protein L596_007705 [Steinernema carpocapsae]